MSRKTQVCWLLDFRRDNTRTIRSSLLLLWGAVGVLLLIACANTGSLIAGKNSHRAKEFAVRLALGCRARRLFQQLTAEVVPLFCCGAVLGLALAYVLVRLFVASNPLNVLPPGGIPLNLRVLLTTAGIILAAAIAFGSVPALRAFRVLDGDALRGHGTSASGAHLRSRTIFVTVEISFSVILLVAAGLLISSFAHLVSTALGSPSTSFSLFISCPGR